jgi:hypothetical protein
MELTRKRKKQIKKLKGQTTTLLVEQRKVLEHANAIIAEARLHAADAARSDIAPRVKTAIDNGVRPAVATGIQAATSAATATKTRLTDEVVPSIVSTIGSAMSVVDLAKDPKVRKIVADASKKAAKAAKKRGKVVVKAAPKDKGGLGFGGVALIVVGVVALIGAAYAAYQTLRADDDLWVADDTESSDKPAV